MCYLQKVANTLWRICQRVANNLWHPVTNLPEGCQYPLIPCTKFARGLLTTFGTLRKGCPNCKQRGNLCAIPLKKVKFKVKNQEAINSYKIIRGSSLNEALSIHTTNSPSQSCETVPLRTKYRAQNYEARVPSTKQGKNWISLKRATKKANTKREYKFKRLVPHTVNTCFIT